MIVLDTTVLVYAVGVEHPLRGPCRAVIEAAKDGMLPLTTTVEVIQEFAHIRGKRRGRADAARVAHDCADLLAPLLVVDADDLRRGLELFEKYEDLGAFGSVLAAVAIGRGAEVLLSADGAFGRVRGLRHVDPMAPELIDVLGGAS